MNVEALQNDFLRNAKAACAVNSYVKIYNISNP